MKTILILLFATFIVFSQEKQVPEASKKPLAAMKKLDVLKGTWMMTMEWSGDNGQTWTTYPTSKVTLTSRLKGMSLAEIPADEVDGGFQLETFLSYDQYREVYRKAVIDDTWGIMDIYEGQIIDGKLIMTNLKAETFFPISKDVSRAFRLTIELKKDKRLMIIDKSDDGGKTWQPNFKTTYIKR